MRTIILGEAPSKTSNPRRPLHPGSSSRRRLEQIADVRRFSLKNLLVTWPGPASGKKGSHFPVREAREAAAAFKRRTGKRRCRVILLGKRLALAFDVRAEYMQWVEHGKLFVAVLPHPSGVNRWWNDPGNLERAKQFMAEVSA